MKFSTSWVSLLAISTLVATAIAEDKNAPSPTPAVTSATTSSNPAPTPATTTMNNPAPTPASSKLASPCWEVSVEHDATYRVDGPPCSGRGPEPAGILCPKKGDVAVAGCWKYLESYLEGGRCVAPVDAECRVIGTGAWGCVWKGAGPNYENPKPTPAASVVTPPVTDSPKPTPAATVITLPTTNGPKPTPAASSITTPGKDGPKKPTPASSVVTGTMPTGTTTPKVVDAGKKDVTVSVTAANFEGTATSPKESQGDSRQVTTLSSGSDTPTTADTSSTLIGVVVAATGVALVAVGAVYYRRRKTNLQDFTMGTPHGALTGDKKGANALLSLPRQTTITA